MPTQTLPVGSASSPYAVHIHTGDGSLEVSGVEPRTICTDLARRTAAAHNLLALSTDVPLRAHVKVLCKPTFAN